MKNVKILWVDDEIDLLKPHLILLEQKGYEVITANNGYDGVELTRQESLDIIFLDEQMPGLSGLETLDQIKEIAPGVPVVMVTKSEEENIMEEAIGAKITDYLIKPVKPNQILLTVKKILENRELVTKKTMSDFQSEFGRISMAIDEASKPEDWIEIYKKLVFWELELQGSSDSGMDELLDNQFSEANQQFSKYIKKHYPLWFSDEKDEAPLLSQQLLKDRIFPMVEKDEKVLVVIIDNLRYDQWRKLYPLMAPYFKLQHEELYYSILPTATQYSRNSFFAGLMPYEISQLYPDTWFFDEEEGGKNLYESTLLQNHLQRLGRDYQWGYHKVMNTTEGQKMVNKHHDLLNNDITFLVYNFVDFLSHARTDREMIKELANDIPAYLSVTSSWFQHSKLLDLIKALSEHDIKLVITTDHGSKQVANPVKVLADKKASTNLRYKTGKNLNVKSKNTYEEEQPKNIHLPVSNMISKFLFASGSDFFVYPTHYNHFVKYYKSTFQHGGISLEEMLIPLAVLIPNR